MEVKMIKSYTQLIKLRTFEERFNYLRFEGIVGETTFGYHRNINQALYSSNIWKQVRDKIIVRDNGVDLGIDGMYINPPYVIHHINPLTLEDFEENSEAIFNEDNLILTSHRTHNAIHYGGEIQVYQEVKRFKNDTCPWR